MAEVQIQSMSHRHKAIADWLLCHPNDKSMAGLAAHLNMSRPWLSVVMNSDVFKEYFEKRRQEWEGEMLLEIGAQQLDIAKRAYQKLDTVICDDDTDPRLIFDIAHKTTERLFGKRSATVTQEHTQEISRSVDAGTLAQAREVFKQTVTTIKEIPLEQLPTPR